MKNEIAYRIIKSCCLDTDRPVLVGVSGGPDSICLLHILHALGYSLMAAYYNHQLRPEANQEAESITIFSNSLGIQAVVGVGDVKAFVQQHSVSVEEAARILRYNFLFEQAFRSNAQAVAVGHTADDQVETVLLHLLRGCGLQGLTGMQYRMLPNAWSNEIPLVRPLLSTWRQEIVTYNQQNQLQSSIDLSNYDSIFMRNRIRLELLPVLENYNSGIRRLIWQMADIIKADVDELNTSSEKAWIRVIQETGIGFVGINRQAFKKESISLQRWIIRSAISFIRCGIKDVDFSTIQQVIEQISNNQQFSQRDLMAGLRCTSRGEITWISDGEPPKHADEWPKLVIDTVYSLDVPSKISFKGDWSISCQVMDIDDCIDILAMTAKDPYQVVMDKDRIRLPLLLRSRSPGDRFKPYGMDGHSQKVSDIMVNQKYPVHIRNKWPLLCSDDEIVWIPGYRIAHTYEVTSGTKKVIHMKINILE